jgi:hypothetical protein
MVADYLQTDALCEGPGIGKVIAEGIFCRIFAAPYLM